MTLKLLAKKKFKRKISYEEEECQCFSIEGNNNIAQPHWKIQHHQHHRAHHMLLNFFFIFNFFLMIQEKMDFLRLL